jgi:hypothetical protein
MLLGILAFGREYIDPRLTGGPQGRQDFSLNLGYLGAFRSELFDSHTLLGWNSTGLHGLPLFGHPHSQLLFPPISIPLVLFEPPWGARLVYVASMLVLGSGMYALARMLSARPLVAAWAGLLLVLSGTLTGQIFAGHVERILAMPFIPWILVCTLLAGRAATVGGTVRWAAAAGALHGCAFLAGSLYVPFYLLFVTPVALTLSILCNRSAHWRSALPIALLAWPAVLALVTSGKLLAAVDLLKGASRTPDPYRGSQDAFWGIAHLIYPFATYGPTLPWDQRAELLYAGQSPGPSPWPWWEYNQYIGIVPVLFAMVAIATVIAGVITQHRQIDARLTPFLVAIAGAGLLALSWIALRQFGTPPLPYRVAIVSVQLIATIAVVVLLVRGRGHHPSARPADVVLIVSVCAIALAWLAVGHRYSPVHWLYEALPAIRQFQVPSRALIFLAMGVLALAAIGIESLLRSKLIANGRWRTALWSLLALSLVDVYLITNWVPKVNQPEVQASFSRLIAQLEQRDPGPFVINRGAFGTQGDRALMEELGNNAVRVNNYLTPLRPLADDQPRRIPPEKWARYAIERKAAPRPRQGAEPLSGSWEPLLEDEQVVVWVNGEADGDAYLLDGQELIPVRLTDRRPGRFDLTIIAPQGAMLILPANNFPGWGVEIDSEVARPVADYDGWVAINTVGGEHRYVVSYRTPMLPAIVTLAAAPWLLGLVLAIRWVRGSRSNLDIRARARPLGRALPVGGPRVRAP